MAQPRPSRRSLVLQLGLLAGVTLALALTPGPRELSAGGDPNCPQEGECTFLKPTILFALDYSSAHNQVIDAQTQATRWDALTDALAQTVAPGSFLSQNTHLALLRFGHDPDPQSPGTSIPGDVSGLVDGLALDLAWDEPETHAWLGCNGQALLDALAATPAPLLGLSEDGIGSWTKAALERAAAEIAQTEADHPEDQGERVSTIVVLTDGIWTGPDGLSSPPAEDPAPVAAALFAAGVSTYVVAIPPSPAALASADALALAGGTEQALLGPDPSALEQAMGALVIGVIDSIPPVYCDSTFPRVMVLLDASSSMLNTPDGSAAAAMGETTWEQARELITGDDNLFEADVLFASMGDITELGLAVFGGDLPAPGEQRLLGQYRSCASDDFEWALDPEHSCVAPGCTDPWAGAPIAWTSQDGALMQPCFGDSTLTHMPLCKGAGPCAGSGSFTHLGLELVAANQASYHAEHAQQNGPDSTDAETLYLNLLITDGSYSGYSTDAQVEAALTGMFDAGVTTYVIGIGPDAAGPNADPAVLAQLAQMAAWGSGGAHPHYDAGDIAALEQVLVARYTALEFDPCCALPECLWEWPRPECPGDGDGDGDAESGDGDGDGDSGDGDGDGESGDGESEESAESAESAESSGDSSETDAPGSEEDPSDETDSGWVDGPFDIDDDGCNCATGSGPRDGGLGFVGLLGVLALLGLPGPGPLTRRRRATR